MFSNAEISDTLSLHAKLLELNGRDERRVKTFTNAAYLIERLEGNVYEMSNEQLLAIQGIGKVLAGILQGLVENQTFDEFEEIKAETPPGVIDLFKIKGIGVKKIKQLWNELNIDSIDKLKKACQENALSKLKGFGQKTEEKLLASIMYLETQRGKLRINVAKAVGNELLELLIDDFERIEITGQLKRFCETIDKIEFICLKKAGVFGEVKNPLFVKDWSLSTPFKWAGKFDTIDTPIEIHFVKQEEFISKSIELSADEKHLSWTKETTFFHFLRMNTFESEEIAYKKFGSNYILPEMREGSGEFEWIKKHTNDELITWEKLRGSVHNHSTYSDGKHTLQQMAAYCKLLGFDYLGIADHSQTATYAQGLPPWKVAKQHEEIAELNVSLAPFKILKGIESDILMNGSLDYSDEVLASFDYVVASVHQTLNMDIVKATDRLVRAIQHPSTTILGHPTGRLLLAREGYPVDFKTVIDACAEYNVVMEINASPYRLDIDWRLIPYCLEKGVMLSINPDAHAMEGYHDMHYGIGVARKGGLTADMTFNAMSLSTIEAFLADKKSRV